MQEINIGDWVNVVDGYHKGAVLIIGRYYDTYFALRLPESTLYPNDGMEITKTLFVESYGISIDYLGQKCWSINKEKIIGKTKQPGTKTICYICHDQ